MQIYLMKLSSFYLAIAAFLVSFVLLVLPGDEFPKSKLFDVKGLDKIVHTTMFFALTWLFCRPFRSSVFDSKGREKWFLQIMISLIVYGILMEFVQKYFVPFRSFELADIGVDSLGAITGYLVSRKMFIKREMN